MALPTGIWLPIPFVSSLLMPRRPVVPALFFLHSTRCKPRLVRAITLFLTGVALSVGLSGCGVFCNIGGGSGGIGGSCGIGTGFRF